MPGQYVCTQVNTSFPLFIVSAVISTLLVIILLGICSGYLYLYGRRNPGGWAEQLSQRLEAPYKRFGILDESNNQDNGNNNNNVEMGAKFSENNNTETGMKTISF